MVRCLVAYSFMILAYYSIGCWEQDPHKRPSFKEILQELDVIAQSGFGETPNESFHTMQDGWKKEINEVLRELRNKEKVKHIENTCMNLADEKILKG